MGDMAEDYQLLKKVARERRERDEPGRVAHASQRLAGLGWTVRVADEHLLQVVSPTGKRFNFWPWTGYWAGPTQGRGLEKLTKAGR